MSYIVTRPQWRALRTIAGARRTVASTARHINHQTLNALLNRKWIKYVTRDGSDTFYRLTAKGRAMLRQAAAHYRGNGPPGGGIFGPKPKKLKAAPNLGPGLVKQVDKGFETVVNTPVIKADKVLRPLRLEPFNNDERVVLRAGSRTAAIARYRSRTGASLQEGERAADEAKECGRKSETPGYLPCRRPPHDDGPCAHEPNVKTALEILKNDPSCTTREAQAIAAHFSENEARAFGESKYGRGSWLSAARDSAGARRDRVLKCVDAQRVPDLVAVLMAADLPRATDPPSEKAFAELARRLLHAARRPPTISELMERARANAGIGGPDTLDQIERETQQAGRRYNERELVTRTALERVALEYAANELSAAYEKVVGEIRFGRDAPEGYATAIKYLRERAER